MSSELVENNMMQVIRDLVDRVGRLEKKNLRATELSEISGDAGLIEAGELRVHSDWSDPHEPGDGFSGTRILGAFEYNGKNYSIVGVNNDTPQFGLSAEDGAAFFCGGAAQIDSDGISGTDLLKWMIRQSATYGTEERYGQLGMEELDEKPTWTLSFYEPSAEAELIDNGDFEDGDFTSWTETTETNCALAVTSTSPYEGSYSGVCTAYTETSAEGVLTSDRFAVTAGNDYEIECTTRISSNSGSSSSNTGHTDITIQIKFYTADEGGDLVSTSTILDWEVNNNATKAYTTIDTGWRSSNKSVTAPATATHAEIVVDIDHTFTSSASSYVYLDSFSAKETAVSNKLQLTDDDLLFNGDSVITDSTVYSGTYTPTLTNTTNIDASTAIECRYIRIGSHVIVSGQVNIDATATGVVVLGMTLPIASTLSNAYELSGTGATNASEAGRISADTTNNRASYTFIATGTINRGHSFVFTYQII